MSIGVASRGLAARLFGIDLRSLALFRIALASMVLVDLALRAPYIAENYTDAGTLPRAVLGDVAPYFSLHLLSGAYGFQVLLFVLTAVSAGMLLLGYRTRLATVATWVLLTSLHYRNYYLGNTGDLAIRLLTIWGMFLPMGACFSIDARGRERPEVSLHVSPATVALLLQFVALYMVAGLVKTGSEWPDGTAIQLVLHQTYWSRELSERLLEHPALMSALSKSVVPFEVFGPLVMFVPVFTAPLRVLGVLVFAGFQLGLGTNMELHWFPVASTVAVLPFLPGALWDRMRPWAGTPGTPVERGPLPWLQNLALLGLGAYGVLANVATIPLERPPRIPNWAWQTAEALGFRQLWDLYAPSPRQTDPAYGVVGRLPDGRAVILAEVPTREHSSHSGHSFQAALESIGFLRRQGLREFVELESLDRAYGDDWDSVRALHRTTHFKGSLFQLARGNRRDARRETYLRWMCARWNRDRPPAHRLERTWLLLMEREILLEGWGPTTTHLLLEEQCAED